MSLGCNFAEPTARCRNDQNVVSGLISNPGKPCREYPVARSGNGNLAPTFEIRQLWREVRALNLTEAREGFQATEQKLITSGFGSARHGYADLLAIHAMTLALEDDTLSAFAAAEQALRRGASEKFARLSRLVLRFCAWKAGAAPASSDDFTLSALQATGSRSGLADEALADVLDLSLAAAIEFSRLQLSAAVRLARCALRRAEQMRATCAAPAGILGRILYGQGSIQEAEQLLRSRLPITRAVGSLDCVGHTYGVLARIAAYGGDRATAQAILDEASELAEARNWPRLLAAVLAERVRMCEPEDGKRVALWLGQLQNLTERHKAPVRCARSEIAFHLSRAQIYSFLKFRAGAPPRAALAFLRHDARLGQDFEALTWVNLAEAQTLWVEGYQEKGICRLAEVLRTAEVTGLR